MQIIQQDLIKDIYEMAKCELAANWRRLWQKSASPSTILIALIICFPKYGLIKLLANFGSQVEKMELNGLISIVSEV